MMNVNLNDATVLWPSPWCVIRAQEEQYLIYNRKSDELHLIPQTGYYAFQLCDGFNSIADVERLLANELNVNRIELKRVLYDFLGKLVERGVLNMEFDGKKNGTR